MFNKNDYDEVMELHFTPWDFITTEIEIFISKIEDFIDERRVY